MAKAAMQIHSCPAGMVNFWFWCYFCFFSGWHHRWCGKLCSCCRDPERAWSLQDFCDGYSWTPVSRCPPSHRGILYWWGASTFWTQEEGLGLVAGLIKDTKNHKLIFFPCHTAHHWNDWFHQMLSVSWFFTEKKKNNKTPKKHVWLILVQIRSASLCMFSLWCTDISHPCLDTSLTAAGCMLLLSNCADLLPVPLPQLMMGCWVH